MCECGAQKKHRGVCYYQVVWLSSERVQDEVEKTGANSPGDPTSAPMSSLK